MMQVSLTAEEVALLKEVLDAELTDLRGEITKTDRHSYREMLKQRELVLKELIRKIQLVQSVTPLA